MKIDSVVGLITNSSSVLYTQLDNKRIAKILELFIDSCSDTVDIELEYYYDDKTSELGDFYYINFDKFSDDDFSELIRLRNVHSYEHVAHHLFLYTGETSKAMILEVYNDDYNEDYDENGKLLLAKSFEDIPEMYLEHIGVYPKYVLVFVNGVIDQNLSKLLSQQQEIKDYG